MKSLRFFLVNVLTLVIGLGLMSGSFSNNDAEAAPTATAPKIQVQKVGNYKGQYLTVFYAIGTRPFFSINSRKFTLTEVKAVKTQMITGDFVDLPKIDLQKQGFRPGYNLVVIAISPAPGLSLVNADGSPIAGMPVTSNYRANVVSPFSKAEIESLAIGQGLTDGVVLTLD